MKLRIIFTTNYQEEKEDKLNAKPLYMKPRKKNLNEKVSNLVKLHAKVICNFFVFKIPRFSMILHGVRDV